MSATYLWHLWPGRHWPASIAEERAFIEELRTRQARIPRKFERGDLTAVLNILRLGLTLADVVPYAPGLKAPRLVAAYSDLEATIVASRNAFLQILTNPSAIETTNLAPLASRLMPVPTYHLTAAAHGLREGLRSEEYLHDTVQEVQRLLDLTSRRAAVAEAALLELTNEYKIRVVASLVTPPSADPLVDEIASPAVQLGKDLYDPYDACLWSNPYYLPRRLTDLVPGRVADLLGESDS